MCVMWRVHGTTHQVDMINVCGPQVCRPAGESGQREQCHASLLSQEPRTTGRKKAIR